MLLFIENLKNLKKFLKIILYLKKYLRYDDLFSEIWFASAFKGATHHLEIIPNAELHRLNHLSWLNIIRNFPSTHKIKGMILTGWSRYLKTSSYLEY